MTDKEIRMLQEKLIFRTRVIVVGVIILVVVFIVLSIAEDIGGSNYMEREIEMIARSDEWHQVTDRSTRETVLHSLEEQEAITEKENVTLLMLNEERTLGAAVLFGPVHARTFVTFDYDKKAREAIPRYIYFE